VDQFAVGWEDSMRKDHLKMGLFWSKTLSKFWLSVEPIFTVLPITSSFLIRFWPVKYQIEGIDVLYTMARKGLINS
jgi:hypothetical protein